MYSATQFHSEDSSVTQDSDYYAVKNTALNNLCSLNHYQIKNQSEIFLASNFSKAKQIFHKYFFCQNFSIHQVTIQFIYCLRLQISFFIQYLEQIHTYRKQGALSLLPQ
ncbi:hypothetical protein TTHERM_000494779 (macronuclear) [Tetrahymena thermophila SB210]|uniref:Uncharacterized protein n=1 Tax=Tetrahymena thermophila (strain SB210) TaxID=312017 RepID=W7X7M2_TETTS|nr:hypothetical protein TTHERM_000494779 [Tetrahymena thermophila SB210]EWS72398.1 hypothetical protein TTHERM_000494779 [Tetrahymena thermophila SB210]|eukprot:XP_012655082.1 hypothetical protein TTHERM_000494779 [Tetrahymena thermophila SB210]